MPTFREKLQYLLHHVSSLAEPGNRPDWTPEIRASLVASRQSDQHICHTHSWSNICRDLYSFLQSQDEAFWITHTTTQYSFRNAIKRALGVGTATHLENIEGAYNAFIEAATRYFGHTRNTVEPTDPAERYNMLLRPAVNRLFREINSCPANLRLGGAADNIRIGSMRDPTRGHKASDTLLAALGRHPVHLQPRHAERAGVGLIRHEDIVAVRKFIRSTGEWKELTAPQTREKYASGGHFVMQSGGADYQVVLRSGTTVGAIYVEASP